MLWRKDRQFFFYMFANDDNKVKNFPNAKPGKTKAGMLILNES